jgi:hypothetical protein
MKQVMVGMFNLPGLAFDKHEMTSDLTEAMCKWADETNCGMLMTDRLWSFKNEGHRDFFIVKWGDQIPQLK